MTDTTSLSDADLLAQIQAAQQAQSQGAATHTVAPAPTGFLQYDPTSGMSTADKVLAGTGRGMVHTARAVGNLVGAVPDSVMTEQAKTDAPLLNTRSGSFGNLVGESAITAPLGMGAAKGLGMVGKLGAALARNPISNSAIQGGVQGLATADPGDRGVQATMGTLTGGMLGANQSLVGKLVNGLKRTPESQALLNSGVSLTPGQLNPTGTWNQLENALEHAPMAGPMVKTARENAEHQWQAAAINKGAAPGSAPIKSTGNINDMLQQAQDSYKPLYDQAKGYPVSPVIMRTNGPNVPLNATFQAAARAPGVPASLQKSENVWLQDRLTQLGPNPDSGDLLELRSAIRQRGRMANLKTDTNSGHVANISNRAEQGVTAALNSQLPPGPLKVLASADSNYGNYKILENAVARAKDSPGGMTPAHLSSAVKSAVDDPSYAKGAGGPLRDFAQQGTQAFQEIVPANGKSVAALSALAAAGVLHPGITAASAGASSGFVLTPGGRAMAAGMTAPQQSVQKLMAALRNNTPAYARNVGGQLALRGATAAGMPVTQAALPNALAAALMLAPPVAQPH